MFLFENVVEICIDLYLCERIHSFETPTICFYFLWGGPSLNYGSRTPQTPHNSHPGGGQSELGRWQSTQEHIIMNTHVALGAGTQLHRSRYWHLKRIYCRNTQITRFSPSKSRMSDGVFPELVLMYSNRLCTSLYQS